MCSDLAVHFCIIQHLMADSFVRLKTTVTNAGKEITSLRLSMTLTFLSSYGPARSAISIDNLFATARFFLILFTWNKNPPLENRKHMSWYFQDCPGRTQFLCMSCSLETRITCLRIVQTPCISLRFVYDKVVYWSYSFGFSTPSFLRHSYRHS